MSNKHREDERRRREAAQASTAKVESGGYEVAGRSIKQMVSVRLEAQLLKELRELAEQRSVSISDLLRQAAVGLVEQSRTTPVLEWHYRPFEASSGLMLGQLTGDRQPTSGVPSTNTGAQVVSGNEGVLVG
jgi:uncharacterized protein (DUF4415 family)